jgi:hypothetical protein
MARLTARILRLERLLPTDLETELQALSDEELDAEIAQLSGVSVEEVRAWTPEEQQRRDDEIVAALSEVDVLDMMRQAPRLFHGLLEEWRELQRESTHSPCWTLTGAPSGTTVWIPEGRT